LHDIRHNLHVGWTGRITGGGSTGVFFDEVTVELVETEVGLF